MRRQFIFFSQKQADFFGRQVSADIRHDKNNNQKQNKYFYSVKDKKINRSGQ
jgi:hypothetical protein